MDTTLVQLHLSRISVYTPFFCCGREQEREIVEDEDIAGLNWGANGFNFKPNFKMAGLSGISSLTPKTKNIVVAGSLTAFVSGVYYYTMRAVGGADELQVAIDKFEQEKSKTEADTRMSSKA